MDTPIPFEGKFTFPLYRAAQLLHLGWKKFLIFLIPMAVIPGMALSLPNWDLLTTIWSSVAGLLVVSVLAWRINAKWKKVFNTTPYFQYPYSGEISIDGYKATSQRGTAEMPWVDVTDFKSDGQLLIFYQGPAIFHIMASSFFATPEHWISAKELIIKNVRRHT